MFIIKIQGLHACTILSCYEDFKDLLDEKWRQYTGYYNCKAPTSLKECHTLKRKRDWNLMNYDLSKLYILTDVDLYYGKCTLNKYAYPELFICVTALNNIQEICILRKVKALPLEKEEYSVIGSGYFWNCILDLDPQSVCNQGSGEYIKFDNEYNPMRWYIYHP